MEQFLLYHKRMFIVILIVSGMAALFFFVLMPGELSYGMGFLIGAAAQVTKFGFLDVSTIRNIAANPKNAAKTQLMAMFFTLIIFSAAIVLALRFKLNVWAMAAGIFLPRIILLADTFLRPDPFSNKGNSGTSPGGDSDSGQSE